MNDINPIKDRIDLPIFTSSEILTMKIVALFIVASIIFWLAWKYGKKYFKKKEDTSINDIQAIDYSELIKEKFRQSKKIFEREDYKEFHLKIADLLRFYFDKKYNCNALMMTSTEINRLSIIPDKQKEKIKIFFEKNDIAKFAGASLEKETARDVLNITEEIIKY